MTDTKCQPVSASAYRQWIVSSDHGPTIKTWSYSARNAKFAYGLEYRVAPSTITVAEVVDDQNV